jgi:hypothetical protein
MARVFPGPSNFTVPIYRLFSGSLLDWMFIASPDGAVPSASGYTVDCVVAYVYPTQTCGSIPLYSVFSASLGDHWYTTNINGRNRMIQLGYVDSGIQGFVLPLGTVTDLYLSRIFLLTGYTDCGCT